MMNYKVKKKPTHLYNFALGLLNYSIITYLSSSWKLSHTYCWFFGCPTMLLPMNCTMHRNKTLLFSLFVLCIPLLRSVQLNITDLIFSIHGKSLSCVGVHCTHILRNNRQQSVKPLCAEILSVFDRSRK